MYIPTIAILSNMSVGFMVFIVFYLLIKINPNFNQRMQINLVYEWCMTMVNRGDTLKGK